MTHDIMFIVKQIKLITQINPVASVTYKAIITDLCQLLMRKQTNVVVGKHVISCFHRLIMPKLHPSFLT